MVKHDLAMVEPRVRFPLPAPDFYIISILIFMPNTTSAKKALRGSVKKRKFNRLKTYKIKNSLKELRKNMAEGGKNIQEALGRAYSALDKAVKTNFIPKGRADRRKSRLSAMVEKFLKAGK
jgi:small subunit ribosomal protein S20